MTARPARPRHSSGSGARLVAILALAAAAWLAPDVFEDAATPAGQLLGWLVVAIGELLNQALVEPLVDGIAESITSTPTPATGP